MNHTIIGTAGHVDHGKTQLIGALTGMQTDRLAEEKKRGITIELGFAYLELPGGGKAGIIDVPGHEKFIKNMLAGAGSIDVALLVVAADEGFMPQTREHLDILRLLDIKRGIIALTKTDLVDDDWRELVTADIAEQVGGTFLENAPVVPVSSVTGEGIEQLKQQLFALLEQSDQKESHVPFRLPVDRVFPVDGFGTVVTGTLTEGQLAEGDGITVYPSMLTARARNIQVHGQDAETAYAGQRVAVNLAGLKYTDVARGDTLAAPGSMENSALLDVRLDILPNTGREVVNNSRLHLHHGSSEMLCRLVLLDTDVLAAGQSGYAQLRLSEPLAARPGDRFVVRFYSPLETIGGGIVLDPNPSKHPRHDAIVLSGMRDLEDGTLEQQVAQIVLRRSGEFPPLDSLKYLFFQNNPLYDDAANALLKRGELLLVADDRVAHQGYVERLGQKAKTVLSDYHKEHPLKAGMRRDELWTQLLPKQDFALVDRVIGLIAERGFIRLDGNLAADADFSPAMSDEHKAMTNKLIKIFLDSGVETPGLDELNEQFAKEKKAFKQSFDALIDGGELVMLTPKIAIHCQHYDAAVQAFDRLESEHGEVTLAAFRDALGTSRKYALALLEQFDRKGMTKKEGDARRRK